MDAAVGEVIGGYRLERLIGAGSTSQVFLGTHVRLGRKAAIKVLSHQLLDNADVVSRLLQEARIVNDIRHPNIIDIIDFVESESPRRVALVMEYIEGPSLKALRDHKHSYDQALGMAIQLVEAVKAAHAAGVIHRDIKPDNLLLTTDPRSEPNKVPVLKMVDFGIAKLAGPGGGKTAAGTMLGTPAYMAPEQVAGRPPPSTATDVFAVGEVIYELFTGTRAYPATTIHETVRAKLRGEIPKLELPAIPGDQVLLALVTSCLQRRPTDRPTLEAVAQTLTSLRSSFARSGGDLEKQATMPPLLSPPPPPPPITQPAGAASPAALFDAIEAASVATMPPENVDQPWRGRGPGPPGATTELSPIGPAMSMLSQLAQKRVEPATTAVSANDPFPNAGAVPTRPNELPPVGGMAGRFPPNEQSSPTNKVLPALTELVDRPTRPPGMKSTLQARPKDHSHHNTDEIANLPTRVLDAIEDVAPFIDSPSAPYREAVTSQPELESVGTATATETPAERRGLLGPAAVGGGYGEDELASETRITEIRNVVPGISDALVTPADLPEKKSVLPWVLAIGVLLLLAVGAWFGLRR